MNVATIQRDNRYEAAAVAAGVDQTIVSNEDYDRRRFNNDHRRPHGTQAFRPALPPQPLPPFWESAPGAVRLTALADHGMCKFPVGEGGGEDQLFCADPTTDGRVYCVRCMTRVNGRAVNPRGAN